MATKRKIAKRWRRLEPRPKRTGLPVMIRLQAPQISAVDAWIAKTDVELSRPEAIRRMVDIVLGLDSR